MFFVDDNNGRIQLSRQDLVKVNRLIDETRSGIFLIEYANNVEICFHLNNS